MLVVVQLLVPGLYFPPVLKCWLVSMSLPPHTTISVPVQTDVCAIRPAGALLVVVAIQLFVTGLYLPPVLKTLLSLDPPQTIISLPVQTAVASYRPVGALVVPTAVQLSVLGLYFPPVLK